MSSPSGIDVDGSALSGDTSAQMGALDLVALLLRHKVPILAVTVAVAALAGIICVMLPNLYTATTTIFPRLQKESAATALAGELEAVTGLSDTALGVASPTDVCIAILKGRSIQDALVNQFDLRRVYSVKTYDGARRKLDDHSEILADKEGQVSISVTDRDPQRAAQIANAYVEQLRSLNQRLAQSEAKQRRAFYENELATEHVALSTAELSLRGTQEKTGLIQPDAQTRVIVDTEASTRAQIGVAEARLEAMRLYATPDNPDLQRAKVEIAGLREQLAKVERSTDALGNGNLEIPAWRLPQAELEYVRRERSLKYHEALYEFLSKQAEAARLDEAGQGAMVEVIDQANVPETRSGPHRLMIVLVAAAEAFVLCCLAVMIAESVGKRREARLYESR